MSTSTGYGAFGTVAQSGSYKSWVGNYYVSCNIALGYENNGTKALAFSIPSWAGTIPAGAETDNISLRFKAFTDVVLTGPRWYTLIMQQNGSTTWSVSRNTTSTSLVTYTDKSTSYFGLTGSAIDIMYDIVQGDIKVIAQGYNATTVVRYDVNSLEMSVNYSEPDTKRAAIIACIP